MITASDAYGGPVYSALPTFRSFGKIARWNREVVVTEKIDGAHGQVYVGGEGQVLAASRTRWINPGRDDVHDFAAWVAENRESLRAVLGPGCHHGEWWGKGINRGYDGHVRTFSLFNTTRFDPLPEGCPGLAVVPVVWRGLPRDCNLDLILRELRSDGSRAAPGYMRPEGLVIYHTAGNCLFKVTVEGDDKPKGGHDADP